MELGYDTAKDIIQQHYDAMGRIAEALLEREVLDGAEVLSLINGKTLPKLATPPRMSNSNDGGTVISPHPPTPLPGMIGGESPQPA